MRSSFLQWFAVKFLDRTLPPRELVAARQLIYGVLILILVTGSFFWRRYVVEAQASALAVREESRGDLELSGSVLRLTLTGSRGLATCALWMTAIDKQKKNQWNELEYHVRWLTRLQPHFITPWLFQSWNLTYNVSVESDRVFDKYFYITRGILLLAEGERQNRDIPDMRFWIGFYINNKICTSDETNVHRSLFQLSCIAPNERDPARFRVGTSGDFNWAEFEKFCKNHPRLARRLREGLRREVRQDQERQFTCEDAKDVVQFLADNWRVPSLYKETMPTADDSAWRPDLQDSKKIYEDQFPIMPPDRIPEPPQRLFQPTDAWQELNSSSPLRDDLDGWSAARAWYGYAIEPIPDPDDIPGYTKEVEPGSRGRQRRNRSVATILFRCYPALSQTHHAESQQEEGWFDETPWRISSWFQAKADRFGDGGRAEVSIPREQSSAKSWIDARQMWQKYGEVNHLLYRTAQQEADLNRLALQYYKAEGLRPGTPPRAPGPEVDPNQVLPQNERERLRRAQYNRYLDTLAPEERDRYQATRFVWEYDFNRRLANFPHHYMRATVEAEKETVEARRRLFDAETLRLAGSYQESLETYHPPGNALKLWLEVLDRHHDYRDDDFVQELTYDIQLRYLDLINKEWGWRLKQQLTYLASLMGEAGQMNRSPGSLAFPEVLSLFLLNYGKPPGTLSMFAGPYDIVVSNDDYNQPAQVMATLAAATPISANIVTASMVRRHMRPLVKPQSVFRVLERRQLIPPPRREDKAKGKQRESAKDK